MLQNKSPVFILNTQAEREHGRKAQLSNIVAGKVWQKYSKAQTTLYNIKSPSLF